MKKLKITYTITLVICTIIFITAIGLMSIETTFHILEESAFKELNLKSQNACLEFDANINSIEQCVNTLCSAAQYHLHDFERFKTDADYVAEYTEELRNLILYSAEHTQGALSVYMRFNPEFTSPTSGLFFVYDETTGEFLEHETTDFSKYPIEDAIWYTVPVNNGCATWLAPYLNNFIDYGMISYVVPYYVGNELVGIIGMDIDYEYIKDFILSINAYENGYAFLATEKGELIVHKDYELYDVLSSSTTIATIGEDSYKEGNQYKYNNGIETIVFSKTKNNMFLCVAAPNIEIYHDCHQLTTRIIALTLLTLIAVSVVSSIIIKKMSLLSETDELTGIYNRKYFIRAYQELKKEDLKKYSLFLFDIDYFKKINDSYGHNVGDLAIKNVAVTAKNMLGKHTIIARWGGDEFIGLIKTDISVEALEHLRATLASTETDAYGVITLSIGLTKVDSKISFKDICEKADQALYISKTNGRNQLTIS